VNRAFFRCRLAALVGMAACAGRLPTRAPVPALPVDQVALSLYLIGDAGAPDPRGEPVLQALSDELGSRSGERVVVFMGDNAYPRGLPLPGQPDRKEAERRLTAQVGVITRARVKGYFVPGNHDWARHRKDGWQAIQRQQAFIDSAGGGAVVLLPEGGCPGPSVVDLGRRVRLVLLDTQWWLHHGPKPLDPNSSCPADSEREVVDSLHQALAGARDRLVVVVAHHPFASGGEHGGHFTWQEHLFPLRTVAPWLWIPLPWIGSLYPAARREGISSQDIPSTAYQRLIAALRRAFTGAAPALYAAGHEHNLQVIAGGPARLELVSGGGIYGHSGAAVPIQGTRFARQASGYARLDVPITGKARLALLEVDRNGHAREVFSSWVE
jgi:Calcineurin-like phosphoesterase